MLRQINKIDIAFISSIEKVIQTDSTIKVELLPGESWIPVNFTSGSAELSEKTKKTSAGISFEQKIRVEIPCSKIDTATILSYINRRLILRIIYNTGEIELVGTPEFSSRMESDMTVKQSSYYKFEFICNTIYKTLLLIN